MTIHLEQLLPRWKSALSSPQWYCTVIPEVLSLTEQLKDQPTKTQTEYKTRIYDFFEDQLDRGNIALGRDLAGADTGRKPIDMVVIHHTSNPPGLSEERLSAIELLRLYGPYFLNPKSDQDRRLKGQPIASGHVHGGKQVFWPYHWIVRGDGHPERLLLDSEIGWHAGDWEVNCRSVAITLDNDYERRRPSAIELEGIARIIMSHYRHVDLARIVGHREVNSRTLCPSSLFLDGPKGQGWKKDLLQLINDGKNDMGVAA